MANAMLVLIGRRDWFERECGDLLGMRGMEAERRGLALWVGEGEVAVRLRGRHKRVAVLAQPGARASEEVAAELRMMMGMHGEAAVAEVQGMAAAMADLDELKKLGR